MVMAKLGLTQCPVLAEKGDCNITSPFGYRIDPITKKMRGHKGIDLTLWLGYSAICGIKNLAEGEVIAAVNTVVISYAKNPTQATLDLIDKLEVRGGNYVAIKHEDGHITEYKHLLVGSVKVKKGDKVAKGQALGYMGTSGYSTGEHLHFEIYKIVDGEKVFEDPLPYIKGEKVIGGENMGYPILGNEEFINKDTHPSDRVTKLQQILVHKYGYDMAVDGAWTDKLEKAIRDYQTENGLGVDGRCGPATIESLNRDLYSEIKELRKGDPVKLKKLQEQTDKLKTEKTALQTEVTKLQVSCTKSQQEAGKLANERDVVKAKLDGIKSAVEIIKSI